MTETPRGISDPERVEERLSGIARGCTPSIQAEIDKFQPSKKIFLVYARVSPANSLTLYQSKVYTRTGSTSHEATAEEITRIVMRMQRASAPSKASKGQRKKKGTLKSTHLPRTPEMFERGLLKPGDVLTIFKRENSQAVVVDGSNVRYGDQIMSYNEWGEKVTG